MTLSPAAAALVQLAREDAAGTLVARLATMPGRCSNGFADVQHPQLCNCKAATYDVAGMTGDEWTIFTAAVKAVAREDGTVHQCDMRPVIRGRIEPKAIGRCYRRAKAEGLLVDTLQREESNDVAGRNTDKLDRIYALGGAA